jgi:hypothetical protein
VKVVDPEIRLLECHKNNKVIIIIIIIIVIVIISVMKLGHLLTRFVLTYPEVSSKVCHNSFCQLGKSVSLPWVIYYEAFHLLLSVRLASG